MQPGRTVHPQSQPCIALVAGEASGDLLGAALMRALRVLMPDVRFVGLAGEQMRAAGCEPLGDASELAVMGLVEPLKHLPRLLRLRRRLHERFMSMRVDFFIGIDSPAFNLGLARLLRDAGVATAQYVSPQVWAWRRGRVKSIARAVDAVLCLLPFEPAAYAGLPVRAEFVGHPLADAIAPQSGRDAARAALGLAAEDVVVALLPGSRAGEIQRLGADFARTAVELQQRHSGPLVVLAPMVSVEREAQFRAQVQAAGAQVRLVQGRADEVLAAADAALVASGTATLQAMLHGVPMVVAYRLAPLTAFIARDLGLVKLDHFSLPNLLAGEALVPEFFQQAVQPAALADALQAALVDHARRTELQRRFRTLHLALRRDGAARAAAVVHELLQSRGAVARRKGAA